MQTALEEAVADGDAAKNLLQLERDSTALLSKAREAAVQVPSPYHCFPCNQKAEKMLLYTFWNLCMLCICDSLVWTA